VEDSVTDSLNLETLLAELNAAAQGVGAASTKLAKLTKEFDNRTNGDGEVHLGIGARYAIALENELVAVWEESEAKDKRPPAEDIRTALAKRRLRQKNPSLVAEYGRITTEMKALQRWISDNRAVISAKQSVLNGARAIGA
jgi:hypothetical protein